MPPEAFPSDSVFRFGGLLARLAEGWKVGLNLLFPPRCLYCEADLTAVQDGPILCTQCRETLAPSDWTYCRRCGAAVPPDAQAESCGICRGTRLHFDRVVSLGDYRSELGEAVLRMKRRQGEPLSMSVGRLFCVRRANDLADLRPDVIIPVPMFRARQVARGTNSPDILAVCLARHLHVRLGQGVLWRCRNTLPQKNLRPSERFKNVRGAFRLSNRYEMHQTRAVLVDDILTTGATCSEAAATLKQAGASMVAVAVLARGVGDHSS